MGQDDLGSNLPNLPNQSLSEFLVCLQLAIRQPEVDHVCKAEDSRRARLFVSPYLSCVSHLPAAPASIRAYHEVHLRASSNKFKQRSASEELGIIRVGAHCENPGEIRRYLLHARLPRWDRSL